MNEQSNNLRDIKKTDNELEIDLKEVLNALLRNKKFITIFSTIFVLLTGINILTSKKTWEGELQIVLSNKNNFSSKLASAASQLNDQAGGLASLIGLDTPKNQLETEVAILKSPSILLPVFNLVKDERKKSGLKVNNFKFKDWLNDNLYIKLQKGTTVLNLTYKDKNKKIIIPVLKKI